MIAKGKSISHGTTVIKYAMEKENALLLCTWGMAEVHNIIEATRAKSLILSMLAHLTIWKRSGTIIPQKPFFHIEVAPSADESKNYTENDWKELAIQFVRTFDDKTCECPTRKKKSKRLQDCQIAVILHRNTATPHLHIIVNRVTSDGSIMGAHNIGKRAMDTANIINKERGWKLSKDIGNKRKESIHTVALEILSNMEDFDVEVYFAQMRAKGYTINTKKDNNGKYVAYSIGDGKVNFQSSKLGYGRDLTLSRIEATWNKLHTIKTQKQVDNVEYIYTTNYNEVINFSIPRELDDIIQKYIVVPDEEWSDEDLDFDEEWSDELADRPSVAKAAAAILLDLMLPNGYDGSVAGSGGGGIHGELSRWDGLDLTDKQRWFSKAIESAKHASEYYRPTIIQRNRGRIR